MGYNGFRAVHVLPAHRRLADHVEGVPIAAVPRLPGPLQRLSSVPSHHELPCQETAGSRIDPRGELDQAPGEHQCPGGGVDQERWAPPQMPIPVGLALLLVDRPWPGWGCAAGPPPGRGGDVPAGGLE